MSKTIKNKYKNCRDCGSAEMGFRNNGPHVEAVCTDCGAHLKFVSKQFKFAINQPPKVSGSSEGNDYPSYPG